MSFQHPLGYLPETVSNGEGFCHSVYGKYALVYINPVHFLKCLMRGKMHF